MTVSMDRRALLASGAALAVTPALPVRAAVSAAPDALANISANPWGQMAVILARITPPVFADRDFPITDYGAVGDGVKDCSDAFKAAIKACTEAGGGRVLVPRGDWFSGYIHLKSNVNLHLVEGATIKFSQDPKAYPNVHTYWEGNEVRNHSPFIYANQQTNIAITGKGVLDGQADENHWWDWLHKAKPARDRLHALGEANAPLTARVFGDGNFLRPNFISPLDCTNVLIEGVTLLRSPMWQLHPLRCRNVTIRGVTARAHGPNTDGCDPESCSDVLIENCVFDTGDDCIAIKSGRNGDGRRVAMPTQNVIIRGCQMKDGHGGVTIGSEISGGVHHVFAEDCQMDSPNLNYAVRLKNNALRGGLLEHIYCRRLQVGQVGIAALNIDFNYEEGANGPFKPIVRDVLLEKFMVNKAPKVADVQGLPGAHIQDVVLRDCVFNGIAGKSIVTYIDGLALEHVVVNGQPVTQL